MEKAREHSAVIALERLRVPSMPRRTRAVICTLAGLVLVADAVCLLFLGVISLGVTLPLVVGSIFLLLGLRWDAVQAWLDAASDRRKVWQWSWIAGLVWFTTLALFWLLSARTGHELPAGNAPSAIIVLGSGTPDGKPSPLLRERLDLALHQAGRFPQALVVVSGGVGFGRARSEAQVMGDYLRSRNLPPQRIVQEEKSASTAQNLLFSKALLQGRGVSPRDEVLLVSSDYHVRRASWIARRAGYERISLAGAPTPLYVRYNAWLREYFAVLSGWVLGEF